jgi:hypothetical protein
MSAEESAAPDAPPASDRLPLVELVAAVHGFRNGSIVNPGTTFMFDPNPATPGGKPRKFPKWAAPVGDKAEKAKPELKAFDTRPVAAQLAAKLKAGAIAGGG